MPAIPTTVIVVYGEDPEAEPGKPALNVIQVDVWAAEDEWHASYGHQDFVEAIAEIVDRFNLDPLMENTLAARSLPDHQALLVALAEDPRFRFEADIYDSHRAD